MICSTPSSSAFRAEKEEELSTDAHIAIVGRPNVGKSSFLNTLVGSERAVVSEIPGTTRDSLDTAMEFRGRSLVLVDTAGIRRRGRVEQGIEHYALLRTAHALERADVAILLTDAIEGVTAQDTHIAGYALEAAVGLVLAVNKWDVVDRGEDMTAQVEAEVAREFHFAPWMRHHFVSAKTGRNVEATLEDALKVVDERKKRIPTSDLHKLLTEAIAAHPPSPHRGKEVRFRHITQARGKAPHLRVLRRPARRRALHVCALSRESHPRALRVSGHPDQARVQGFVRMSDPATLLGLVIVALVGYGIGSISSGYLVGKIYRNVDLRTVGSGSTGATNTFRTLGRGAGLLVAVFDILKGALAVLFAQLLFSIDSDARHLAEALAAVGAVAGHCWPPLLQGRGGRGVATGFGALLFVATPAWASAVAFFAIGLALTRMVSVGSLASVVGALLGYLLFTWTGWLSFSWATLAFILVGGSIVYVRHIANIQRILRGAEPRIGARS